MQKLSNNGDCVTLTIANRFEEMIKLADWLQLIVADYQLPEATGFALDLVLNEAVVNIISYAYLDDLAHDINISLLNQPQALVLEICDDGVAFNPFNALAFDKTLSLENASPNGRGIHLIKSYTLDQSYQRCDNFNIIRLTIAKAAELCAANV